MCAEKRGPTLGSGPRGGLWVRIPPKILFASTDVIPTHRLPSSSTGHFDLLFWRSAAWYAACCTIGI